MRKSKNQRLKHLSKLKSLANSNDFYKKHIEIIFPDHFEKVAMFTPYRSAHSVGTMVEAAVEGVYEQVGGKIAVAELANWLVLASEQILEDEWNPKGILLELGGTVGIESESGPNHFPRFTAVASLSQLEKKSESSTKKHAEQLAATEVLKALGIDVNVIENNRTMQEFIRDSAWHQFNFSGGEVVTLKGGESMLQWWLRGAQKPKSAFRRALMASHVFASIVDVTAWSRGFLDNSGSKTASAILITSTDAGMPDKICFTYVSFLCFCWRLKGLK